MPLGRIRIVVSTDGDIVVARQAGRDLAKQVGCSATDATLVATAISEVARNIVSHAGKGEVLIRAVPVGADAQGAIEVVARDEGPGIVDVERAMQDGYSTGHGLGLGLPGARRLMDEFEIVSEVGVGTTVVMRKWSHPVTVPGTPARDGSCVEWSAAGRALPGEAVSGDAALEVDLDRGGALVAVVDGLGHGAEAAAAAERACEVVGAAASEPIDEVLRLTHDALAGTRGVAMTVASIACSGEMRWVGVGNVEAHVLRRDGRRSRRAASAVLYGGVLGYRLPAVRVSTHQLEPGDMVLMATDGIAPDFTDDVALADPVARVVATALERWARPTDDALVAAARFRGTAS